MALKCRRKFLRNAPKEEVRTFDERPCASSQRIRNDKSERPRRDLNPCYRRERWWEGRPRACNPGARRFEFNPLRHRVPISQYHALELPNNARQRRLLHVGGSGENQFPGGDGNSRPKSLSANLARPSAHASENHPSTDGWKGSIDESLRFVF